VTGRARALAAAGFAAGLAACATAPPPSAVGAAAPAPLDATADQVAVLARSFVGRTRAEVMAALGPATVVRFDSGYEVWVYRFVEPAARRQGRRGDAPAAGDDASSELVMLFAPAGVVTKVRVRPAVT
jgi:hypothetical protein